MRFCSLGSGSGGNATLIEAGRGTRPTRLLLDCGFPLRELARRLGTRGLACEDLSAVFLSHEHVDHVGCALALAHRHRLPLWMSRGTWHAIGSPDLGDRLHFARDGEPISVGDLLIEPYTVPHDAREPLQIRIGDGERRLGMLTDAGRITPHLVDRLRDCDALLLECNHDRELLAASAYPAALRARIDGPLGHLSNQAAGELLAALLHGGLQHVVAAHLSERNNRPELALDGLTAACCGAAPPISVADQAAGMTWVDLD